MLVPLLLIAAIHSSDASNLKQEEPSSTRSLVQRNTKERSICKICPDESPISHPNHTVNVPQILQEDNIFVDFPKQSTCEQMQRELSQVLLPPQMCQQVIQEMAKPCGCSSSTTTTTATTSSFTQKKSLGGADSEPRQEALVWTGRSAGILSAMASLGILVHSSARTIFSGVLKSPHILRNLQVWMAFFSLISSVGWMVGSSAIPDSDLYGAGRASEALCKAQGFLIQLGITGIFFQFVMTIYCILTITYGWTQERIQRLQNYVYGLPVITGLALSFFGLPYYMAADNNQEADDALFGTFWVCYIQASPDFVYSIVFTIVPIWCPLILSTINVLWMAISLKRKSREATDRLTPQQKIATNDADSKSSSRNTRQKCIKCQDMLVPQRLAHMILQNQGGHNDTERNDAEVQNSNYPNQTSQQDQALSMEQALDYNAGDSKSSTVGYGHRSEPYPGYEQEQPYPGFNSVKSYPGSNQQQALHATGKPMRRGSSVAVPASFFSEQVSRRQEQQINQKERSVHHHSTSAEYTTPDTLQSINEMRNLRTECVVFRYCMYYLFALYGTWPFLTLAHITADFWTYDHYYWWLTISFFIPLQGFINGIIYWKFCSLDPFESNRELTWNHCSAELALSRSSADEALHREVNPDKDSAASSDAVRRRSHVEKTSDGVYQVVHGHELRELGVEHGDQQSVSSFTASYCGDSDMEVVVTDVGNSVLYRKGNAAFAMENASIGLEDNIKGPDGLGNASWS